MDRRLAELRGMYEPFVNALSRFLLLPLPPVLPDGEPVDNWQTSAWMRRTKGFGQLSTARDLGTTMRIEGRNRFTSRLRHVKITSSGVGRQRPVAPDGPLAYRSSTIVQCKHTEGPGHGCHGRSVRILRPAAARSDRRF